MKQTPVYFLFFFEELNKTIEQINPGLVIILSDETTHDFCSPLLLTELETKAQIEMITIPDGEENKNIATAVEVWDILTEFKADRNSLLINLGGGMVTDFGGFVASVYKRGIRFINMPTSLLGMVDAAIGGKNGVDLNEIKNIIGSFSFPVATFIEPQFLNTLPEREFKSGLAEMLKHGLIYNRNHWREIIDSNELNSENIKDLIKESVQIKLEITEKDPFEKGLRKILNFGHTIGHAIESEFLLTEDPLLHGEAIAIGMLVETILSAENELITNDELNEIFSNLTAIFGKTKIEENKINNLLNW